MKNTLKRGLIFAVVLALVVSCTCAFAFDWKSWGKSFADTVEQAAEDYAEGVEANAECEDGNYVIVSDFLSLTNNFIGSIFGAFSGR